MYFKTQKGFLFILLSMGYLMGFSQKWSEMIEGKNYEKGLLIETLTPLNLGSLKLSFQ